MHYSKKMDKDIRFWIGSALIPRDGTFKRVLQ